jgi:hypothetical protein
VTGIRSKTSGLISPCTPAVTLDEPVSSEAHLPTISKESSVGPRGKHDIKSLYDTTVPIELEYSGLYLLEKEKPTNFEEAKINPQWRKAMVEEISSIQKNGTWRLVSLPNSHKTIGLK